MNNIFGYKKSLLLVIANGGENFKNSSVHNNFSSNQLPVLLKIGWLQLDCLLNLI